MDGNSYGLGRLKFQEEQIKHILDDAKRVINYCEHIIALEGVFSPFKELIIDTRNKFNLLLETFTPYTEANSLIVGLQQLAAGGITISEGKGIKELSTAIKVFSVLYSLLCKISRSFYSWNISNSG